MATWKKVIVSDSIQALTVDANALTVSGNTITLKRGDSSTDTVDVSATTAVALNTAKTSYEGSASVTELNYLVGVTSGIQAQFDAIEDTQDLSLSGNIISLTDGGTVNVASATAVALNTAKLTNVTTNLGITGTTGAKIITSSDGTDATLPVATTATSGLMSTAMYDQYVINSTAANNADFVSAANGGTFGGDITISGDLTITGDIVSVDTTNLAVTDAFILLNKGYTATASADSGIIFGGSNGVANSGATLIWDASYNSNDGRLAVVGNMASSAAAGAQTPAYSIAGVFEGSSANAATAEADHVGNIRVEAGEIFIYV